MRGEFLILHDYQGKNVVVGIPHIVSVASITGPTVYGPREITLINTTSGTIEVKETVNTIIELLRQ